MRRIPRQLPPSAQLRTLVAASVGFGAAVAAALRRAIPQLLAYVERERAARRLDAADGGAGLLTAALAGVLDLRAVEQAAQAAGADTARQHRQQLSRQTIAALGVDVGASDASIPTLIRQFSTEYTALIVDVSDETRRRAAAAVAAGVSGSQTAAQIARQLEQIAELAPKRAAKIARDQLGKVHGAINQARQRAMGVTRYTWRTSRDRRVRGKPGGAYPRAKYSHHHREGQVFEWAKPPPDGHPGEAILCRCHAEPVLDDLLELSPALQQTAPPTPRPPRQPKPPVPRAPRKTARDRYRDEALAEVAQSRRNWERKRAKQADTAWNRRREALASRLTDAERDAALFYSWKGDRVINGALREGRLAQEPPAVRQIVDDLDRVIDSHRLEQPAVVHRGLDGEWGRRLAASLRPGDVIQDVGYTSTSWGTGMAAGSAVRVEIRIPAGAAAAPIPSRWPGELELLLPRGARFRVLEVADDGGIVLELMT